jgi:pyruvate dehydrogenase E1 component
VRRDALAVERWNRLHPAEPEKKSYLASVLEGTKGPIIAASDYMKSLPDGLSPWLGSRLVSLGTDGFGRSDNREHLRRHFEVSAEAIVGATLSRLARDGQFKPKEAAKALKELGLDTEKIDPARA